MPAAAKTGSASWGAVVGIILIVILLAVGGAYFFYMQQQDAAAQKLQQEQAQAAAQQQQQAPSPTNEAGIQNDLNASGNTSAQPDVDTLNNSL